MFTDLAHRAQLPAAASATSAVTYVLVKVAPGASVDARQGADRRAAAPRGVHDARDVAAHADVLVERAPASAPGFFTTAVLGIIVGFVVVGQILYSGTLQYIREYGTLKAMGAKNSAVVRVILSQAMISAALGFVVGGVLAVGDARRDGEGATSRSRCSPASTSRR